MSDLSPDKTGSREQGNLAKGVLVNIAGKTVGRGAYILSQVFLARILGPDGFGLYGIGWIFFRIGGILATLGLDSGVIHFASRFWEKDRKRLTEIVLSALGVGLLVGAVIAAGIFLGADYIADAFRKPELGIVLRWFAWAVPGLAGITILAASTRVSKQMGKGNLIEEVVFPGATLLAIGIAFLLRGSLAEYSLASMLAALVSLLLSMLITSFRFLDFRVNWGEVAVQARELVLYSLPVALPALFGTLISLIDRIFTGYYLPDFDTGIYQSVSLISAFFIAVLSAFKTIAAPMLAEHYHAGNRSALGAIMRTSTRWVLNLCLPVFMLVFLLPGDFIGVLFGPSYLEGSTALLILAGAQFVNIIKGPVDQLLIMTGNQKDWLVVTMVAFGANLLANWILIPELGINGAAYSQLITYALLALGGLLSAWKRNGIFVYDRQFIRTGGAVLIASVSLVAIRSLAPQEGLTAFLAAAIPGGLIYLAALYWFGMTADEKRMLRAYISQRGE